MPPLAPVLGGEGRRGGAGRENRAFSARRAKNPRKTGNFRLTFARGRSTLPQLLRGNSVTSPGNREGSMAKDSKKPAAKGGALTKTAIYDELAQQAGITRKQVAAVFEALSGVIK